MNYQALDEALEYIEFLNEAIDPDEGFGAKLRPVFVITMYTASTFDHVVEKFVKGQEYWHAAIAFGPALSKCYSFNFGEADANKGKGGLSFESVKGYADAHPEGTMEVNMILLTPYKYKKIKEAFDFYIQHKEKTSYSFKNLLTQFMGKAEKKDGLKYSQVCSTFVDSILKAADIDINSKNTSLVKPDDLKNQEKFEKYYQIYKGKFVDYDVKKMTKKVDKLANDANNDWFKYKKSTKK